MAKLITKNWRLIPYSFLGKILSASQADEGNNGSESEKGQSRRWRKERESRADRWVKKEGRRSASYILFVGVKGR